MSYNPITLENPYNKERVLSFCLHFERGIMRHKKQTQRFGLVFVLLLIPCCALWFFYRWIFGEDTIIAVPIVLGVVTSYMCAYAFTGGRTPYN